MRSWRKSLKSFVFRQQHPNMDLVVCPYNATHHVQREDEERHIHECEDRRIIDVQKFRFNDQTPGQHGFLANPTFYGSSLIVQDYYSKELISNVFACPLRLHDISFFLSAFRDDESSLNESMSVVMRDQSFRSQISAGGASRSSRSRKSAWDTGPSYPTAKDIFLRRNTTAMTPLRRPQAVSDVDSLAAASSRVDDRNTHGAIFIGSRR